MNLSFENRIAFYYMIATAVIMATVFGAIFYFVKSAELNTLDSYLSYEASKHGGEIITSGDSILFRNKKEWEEREHTEIQVNPVFIQIMSKEGTLMDKSPNLKQDKLPFFESEFGGHLNAKLNKRNIRQVQLPIERNGKIKGYILVAISSESALSVISTLRNVLLISYFFSLIGLYFTSRFLARRSILPIQKITETITRITRNNLKERVELPSNQDEIYDLAVNFNALIERIEKAIEREKQFTTDASHELRTPLAILRGTLEVLIRKPRTQKEYEEKIKYSLGEIEHMTHTLEQLLLLARVGSDDKMERKENVSLRRIIDDSLSRFKTQVVEKNLEVEVIFEPEEELKVPDYYSDIIIDNILSNAIKYSDDGSHIAISVSVIENIVTCTIKDWGIGIKSEDLTLIYDSFYRSDALEHKAINGTGLGLSIAKKCADAISADLTIDSRLGEGTSVTLKF